jgi:hypothetical protein
VQRGLGRRCCALGLNEKKPGMAHGVSPEMDGKLLDGKEDKEDLYEDALMEATADESEKVKTAAAEEKTTSAYAEVPGSKTEEAKTEEKWQQAGARKRRGPIPPVPPRKKETLEYKEVHLQFWGPLANRAAVVRKLGGPANVKWCAVRGSGACPSSRSFGMRILIDELASTALRATKKKSWVI